VLLHIHTNPWFFTIGGPHLVWSDPKNVIVCFKMWVCGSNCVYPLPPFHRKLGSAAEPVFANVPPHGLYRWVFSTAPFDAVSTTDPKASGS